MPNKFNLLKYIRNNLKDFKRQLKFFQKNPSSAISSWIYDKYSNMKSKLNITNIINKILLIIFVLIAIRYGWYEQTKITVIYGAIGILLTYFLLHILVKYFIQNTGVRVKFRFPLKYVRRIKQGLFFIENIENASDKFVFATKHDAAQTAVLNIKAYGGGVWGTNYLDKYKRNKAHIIQNNLAILMIKSLVDDEYVGFTHIFPVSKRTWDTYTAGKIKDNDFLAENIISSNNNDEEPYGLILFSVAMSFTDNDYKNNGTYGYGNYVGNLLEQAIAYHINHHIKAMFPERNPINLLFQNYSETYLSAFEKDSTQDKFISGDKVPIVIIYVTNKIIN